MILLDTPSLIWWVNRNAELSAPALGHIEAQRPGGTILVSAIAAWDIAHWAAQGRLGLRMEPGIWLSLVAAVPEIRFIPIDNGIALEAATLPEPAPAALPARILAATARHTGCPLVTRDTELQAYIHVKTIW
jgi:PIN domain nuclease of toxin-antitoxin system